MPRIFKHLTRTDRLRIEKCLNEGYTYRQIADVLRVHISTIYREIKKGEYQRLNGATYPRHVPVHLKRHEIRGSKNL